jgi:Mrp family chromosome partitioning ATPase
VSAGPLQPAWEVDRFQWPEHCKQLLSPQNQYLADVGQRLSVAARDGLNILAVTSTRRGEGRTTLALCLARAAAAAGVKVALVDADLENPQLVNELGVEAATGWHDVVLNKQPLSEAAIVSLEDRFTFFPWLENSDLKSLNDPAVTRVLKAIAAEHTLVILDLGPVPGRETQLFEDGEACPIDAAILVRDVRWTSALEAQRVASQLIAAGTGSVGIAENFGPRVTQAA